jgi:adenine phosphoribosyltransferase
MFAAPLAYALGIGFVPVRKPGKLPGKTMGHDYALEYGTDRIEIHDDAILAGERVLIVDDLLATGGTALAAATLVQKMNGNIVECAFLVDLPDIGGRRRLEQSGLPVFALCEFEGD